MEKLELSKWTLIAPAFAAVILSLLSVGFGSYFYIFVALALLGSVLASVHHAETVAHRVGEPYGTLTLAVSITVIEVGLIVSLMIAGGSTTTALARDTVFAAVMIIVNGIIGLCLLIGGLRHGEQSFGLYGINSMLATLASISILTLVLPNYTTTVPGPMYSTSQLGFIAVVSLVIYGAFICIQTVNHRTYFLPPADSHAKHVAKPDNRTALVSAFLLIFCLFAVVILAKSLAPHIESLVTSVGAPDSLVGIIIAGLVLLPEGLAAFRAARSNRIQVSLNLSLGSALASIGLTIPAVAVVSIFAGWPLTLGLDIKSTILLILSLYISGLSLGTGKATVLQGTIHLVFFAVYLFLSVVP